jgi:hypothetical protein
VLKKALITTAASAVLVVGVGGYAYASDNGSDCKSVDDSSQSNDGHQLVGGNAEAKDLNGFIGGSIDNGVVCPSGFNDNDLDH